MENRKRKFAWRKRIADVLLLTEEADGAEENVTEFSPEEVTLERERSMLVRQTVNNLPERLKVIVLLYYMEELSVSQIADTIHIPEGTVKSRLYRQYVLCRYA